MKKQILVWVTFFCIIIASAQRNENTIAVQAKYGITKSTDGTVQGSIATSLGVQIFKGKKGFFFEANTIYQNFRFRYYNQIEDKIPYQIYGLNAMAGYSYENLEYLFVNLKLGGFAGYYIANHGYEREQTYQTVLPNPVKGITYGAVGVAELEKVFWKNLAGVVSYSQYYYPKDKWIRWQYAIEIGVKWYFN